MQVASVEQKTSEITLHKVVRIIFITVSNEHLSVL